MLRADVVVPTHYSAFNIIQQDVGSFAEDLQARGLKCMVLKPGEEGEVG